MLPFPRISRRRRRCRDVSILHDAVHMIQHMLNGAATANTSIILHHLRGFPLQPWWLTWRDSKIVNNGNLREDSGTEDRGYESLLRSQFPRRDINPSRTSAVVCLRLLRPRRRVASWLAVFLEYGCSTAAILPLRPGVLGSEVSPSTSFSSTYLHAHWFTA